MGKVDPGKRFENWWKESAEAVGLYVMRIPDKLYWTGQRIASEQTPADFNAFSVQGENGELHCFLVECKACSKHRISFDNLQEHQHDALMDFEEMHENMHGYVAVNYYDNVNIRSLNLCFMVPIKVWDEYKNKDGAMKSLSHEECLEDPRIAFCPRDGKIFDFSRWLGGFK